jgi:hypothetical protein
MTQLTQEDLIESPTSEDTQVVESEVTEETTEQDPLKTELDRVKQQGKTAKQKAENALKYNAQRLKKLGGDPEAILGLDKPEEAEDEDDKPVTLGMLRKLQQQQAEKSAMQLAEEISNETERELTKYHLQNSIKSTGNPTEDLKLARAIVNSVKNSQIAEEVVRKTNPKTYATGGAPAKEAEEDIGDENFTPDELLLMQKPFKLTKKQVLAARKG